LSKKASVFVRIKKWLKEPLEIIGNATKDMLTTVGLAVIWGIGAIAIWGIDSGLSMLMGKKAAGLLQPLYIFSNIAMWVILIYSFSLLLITLIVAIKKKC
jgi:hypothetical protein